MKNGLIDNDSKITLNNCWIQLQRLQAELKRKSEEDNDIELLGMLFTIDNTARAINYVQRTQDGDE